MLWRKKVNESPLSHQLERTIWRLSVTWSRDLRDPCLWAIHTHFLTNFLSLNTSLFYMHNIVRWILVTHIFFLRMYTCHDWCEETTHGPKVKTLLWEMLMLLCKVIQRKSDLRKILICKIFSSWKYNRWPVKSFEKHFLPKKIMWKINFWTRFHSSVLWRNCPRLLHSLQFRCLCIPKSQRFPWSWSCLHCRWNINLTKC